MMEYKKGYDACMKILDKQTPLVNGLKSLLAKLIAALSIHYHIIQALLFIIICCLLSVQLLALFGIISMKFALWIQFTYTWFLIIIRSNPKYSF